MTTKVMMMVMIMMMMMIAMMMKFYLLFALLHQDLVSLFHKFLEASDLL